MRRNNAQSHWLRRRFIVVIIYSQMIIMLERREGQAGSSGVIEWNATVRMLDSLRDLCDNYDVGR